jgi:hypothetical protein
MLELRNKVNLQLPFTITLTLFSLVTARAKFSFPNMSPDIYYYGFPLFWHRWSAASSGERSIYLPGLLIDFAFYFSIVWLITTLVLKRYIIPRQTQNILWFTSIASTLWLLHFFIFRTTFVSSSSFVFNNIGTMLYRTLWLGIEYPLYTPW